MSRRIPALLVAVLGLLGMQLEAGSQATAYQPAVTPGEIRLTIGAGAAVPLGENLVLNASFETIDGNRPKHWAWAPRNTDAAFEIAQPGRRSSHAVRITNGTAAAPHVYGQLTLLGGLPLTPGEEYVLSCYVKSDDPGRAWIGGGDGWWMRLYFGPTDGKWRRFTKAFVARDGDASFPLMVNTDSPTDGLLVDDVKVERGSTPTPVVSQHEQQPAPAIDIEVPDPLAAPSPELQLPFFVYVPADTGAAAIECEVTGDDGETIAEERLSADLLAGVTPAKLTWGLGETGNIAATLKLRLVTNGQVAASEKREVRPLTMAGFRAAYEPLPAAIESLRAAVEKAKDAGAQAAYQVAALQVADRFSAVAQAKAQAGNLDGALQDVADLLALCLRARDEAEAIAEGETPDIPVPDNPMDRVQVNARNFEVEGRPVVLVGPLGYGELLGEIETVRNYGFNVVGDDFDAFSAFRMMTGPEEFDEEAIPRLLSNWDRLRELNLAISYSPTLHYFPEWALKAHPDITGGDPVDRLPDWSGLGRHQGQRTKSYGGFFPFAVESPSVQRLVSQYYAKLFPAIADHPSTHFYWLMNEPTYQSSDPEYLRLYREHLRAKYETIEELNKAWGTGYESFEAIEPAREPAEPGRYDFLDFHQQHVADWFAWLAAEVRKHDSDAIISNKPMAWTILQPEQGIDFERQAEIMDLPGCDASRNPTPGRYAFGWRDAAFLFDFYASVAPDKPQADLEYHYVHQPDVTPEYVRATYWQSYLHGLRLSTFWVWARGQLGEGEAGAGMRHTAWSQPLVAWGTTTSALDLRRLAQEVSHFPPPAEVALYFSRPSLFLDEGAYTRTLQQAYEALFFLDAPVGFITDRMIREGKLAGVKLLVVPAANHLEGDVLDLLRRYARGDGHVALIGKCFGRDEFGGDHRVSAQPRGRHVSRLEPADPEALSDRLDSLLAEVGVTRLVGCLTAGGGNAWAVECRSVRNDDGLLCSLLNLNPEATTVQLHIEGRPVARWQDLISGKSGTEAELQLEPMVPLFLRIDED